MPLTQEQYDAVFAMAKQIDVHLGKVNQAKIDARALLRIHEHVDNDDCIAALQDMKAAAKTEAEALVGLFT